MGKHVTKRRGRAEAESVEEPRVESESPDAPGAPVEPSLPRVDEHRLPALSAAELYRRERARRGMDRPENDLLAEARAAYQALLAQEAASGKGGRPRSKAPATLRKEAAAAPEESESDLGATAEHEIADVEAHDDVAAEEGHDEPDADDAAPARAPSVKAAPAKPASRSGPAKSATARSAPAKGEPKRPRSAKAPARTKAAAPARGKSTSASRAKAPARKKAAPPARKKAGRGR